VWQRLREVLPAADWSSDVDGRDLRLNRGTQSSVGVGSQLCDKIAAALSRSQRRHVLLTGAPGVGKTATIMAFADQLAHLDTHPLAGRRCWWLDCDNIGPEDSRACLEMIFASLPRDEPTILCVEELGSLIRRANGQSNGPMLRNLLSNPRLSLIGTMTPWDYSELIGGDARMAKLFTRIEIAEPDDETTFRIASHHAEALATHHSLEVPSEIVRRTQQLTSLFLLSEHQPAKTIDVLREACEQLTFQRTEQNEARETIRLSDTIAVIAERTGIPAETIAGSNGSADFVSMLSDAVVGQEQAIEEVAAELRLIKAGLSDPGKPATVMLFAGLTGVGKTELAKRIAEVYSSSRRLQVYSMGNFTEPHSVSGIIGVPPGYVGHDQGGRLINELNADPYSVFLLDEAEKCHPNVWKPFLNLFDEGWIADQRGVRALADRAIFILTTNAGDRQITSMTESGRPWDEIAEAVRQTLSRIRQERSSQPVFPPQFLSRIRRIVVFGGLSESAMIGIAERSCRRLQKLWKQKREIDVEVGPELIRAIGQLAHVRNQQSRGQEGGRIVQKLLDAVLQDALLDYVTAHPGRSTICISLSDSTGTVPADPHQLREQVVINCQRQSDGIGSCDVHANQPAW
jgi:ATP-dependent Clp protease ATP-binding subunit ClpA